jgi:hypothetical protein
MIHTYMKREHLTAPAYEMPDATIIKLTATESILTGSWDRGEINDSFTDVYDL